MRSKHFRMWHCATKWEKNPDPGNWEKVIAIIQTTFRGGEIAALCAFQMVVMIPKGGDTNFRVIGLVEVLWKAISGIINRRLSSSIQFHDALNGFCTDRGTGIPTLKANLRQYLIAMREMVLYSIFLDIHKAYNTLERYRCLDILAGCGVGPRTLRILRTYWAWIQMAAKAGGLQARILDPLQGNSGGAPLTHNI